MDGALWAAVAGLVLVLALVVAAWRRQVGALRTQLRELDHRKRSQSTRYGQITEQFAPFMADWPWDPKGFRFLGTPIDGVQFTPQGIVFVEIKSASSQLSAVQREARDHVLAGRVFWHEHRIQ